jgi:hypothetical protein
MRYLLDEFEPSSLPDIVDYLGEIMDGGKMVVVVDDVRGSQ